MSSVKTKFFDYGSEETEYLAQADPILGEAMRRIGRVEREVIPDIFAALVYAIIGQLISVRAAHTVWNRMQDRFGEITPANLAKSNADEIQQCGMTVKKAILICDLSKEIVQGSLCLNCFRELSDHDVIRCLTSIKGIGCWTAEMLLINCMERPDVVSWGDIAIRRGMEKLYGIRKLTKKQFEAYRKRYSPYGSVASIYLWQLSFL